ncbi:hypothetical protein P9112_005901 [Eukaryota sp. TZLM1-RC]
MRVLPFLCVLMVTYACSHHHNSHRGQNRHHIHQHNSCNCAADQDCACTLPTKVLPADDSSSSIHQYERTDASTLPFNTDCPCSPASETCECVPVPNRSCIQCRPTSGYNCRYHASCNSFCKSNEHQFRPGSTSCHWWPSSSIEPGGCMICGDRR